MGTLKFLAGERSLNGEPDGVERLEADRVWWAPSAALQTAIETGSVARREQT